MQLLQADLRLCFRIDQIRFSDDATQIKPWSFLHRAQNGCMHNSMGGRLQVMIGENDTQVAIA